MDDKGTIIDAKFKTFGCGSAIASSSLATEWIKGKNLDFASKVRNEQIVRVLEWNLTNAFRPKNLVCLPLSFTVQVRN